MEADTQQLFNYLSEEHNATLLEYELDEVYRLCGGYDKDKRIQELEGHYAHALQRIDELEKSRHQRSINQSPL